RWRSAPATSPDIQASLPFDTTLIEYRVLNKSIVVWVVAPDAFTAVTLPVTISDIEPAIVLDPGSQEPRVNASLLYDALIRPVESLLKDSKVLVVVPDDELERVAY